MYWQIFDHLQCLQLVVEESERWTAFILKDKICICKFSCIRHIDLLEKFNVSFKVQSTCPKTTRKGTPLEKNWRLLWTRWMKRYWSCRSKNQQRKIGILTVVEDCCCCDIITNCDQLIHNPGRRLCFWGHYRSSSSICFIFQTYAMNMECPK